MCRPQSLALLLNYFLLKDHTPQYSSILECWLFDYKHNQKLVYFRIISHGVTRSGRNACGAGSSFPSSSLPSPGSSSSTSVCGLCVDLSADFHSSRTVPAVLWCRSQPVSRQRDVAASPRHVTTTTTSWSPGHRDTRDI